MSLAINSSIIRKVLLADGWHKCTPSSFFLDSYEYFEYADKRAYPLLTGGQEKLIPATGFCFEDEDGHLIQGPITSILAVSY